MAKLVQTDSIIHKLFDPEEKSFKVFVDETRKQVYRTIPMEAKVKYLEYFLQKHWSEICGEQLSKQCSVESLKGSILNIKTISSMLANELFMMRGLLLKKINKALAGSAEIKELKFSTGNILVKNIPSVSTTEVEQKLEIIHCPQCGAKMLSDNELCNVCARENKFKLQHDIIELLKVQPWLKYEECQEYIPCSRIAFNDAKEILQNFYFEKVRLDFATELDSYIAVMLLTGKSAEDLDEKSYKNGLEFLRRNRDVSTSGV